MSRDDIAALRAEACGLVAALGQCLDSLSLIDQMLANPGDAFSDGVIISQHLDEAACCADNLAGDTDEFAQRIDRLAVATKASVIALEKGGA